ncbi:MAG: M1 family aminopeptidase [Candidatus Sulfotelmatobacter sp.]
MKRILATVGTLPYVTKVPSSLCQIVIMLVACATVSPGAHANIVQSPSVQVHQPGPAESLYLQLSSVGLDPTRVFRVRDGSLDRSAIHITLEDGTIAFTKDVMGRITGAFFEGDGEVLLIPPNEMERKSMSLFTGMAILEERFSTAYFRFNDNIAAELQPSLREPKDSEEFANRWDQTAGNLAAIDAMRLLAYFSEMLPIADHNAPQDSPSMNALIPGDRMLHARIQGNTLGVFDVLFDSTAAEQVEAGQSKTAADGTVYYDVWTSFSIQRNMPERAAGGQTQKAEPAETATHEDPFLVSNYAIDAQVIPPKELAAEVKLDLQMLRDGSRFIVFELSRFLQIQTVEQEGRAVEFIQNPAVEGTRLARSGNDMVAVILSEPARKGQKTTLRFVYRGEVLAEAGKGLLYVGARGTWYPNRGLAMSDFDLTFHYPPGWTLVATGRSEALTNAPSSARNGSPTSASPNPEDQVSSWVSERPIPVAGFDLGKYVRASAQAGNINVEAYATVGVERDFATPRPSLDSEPELSRRKIQSLPAIAVSPPSPAHNAMAVAESTAQAIRYYSEHFGPYPYSKLALTQLPGRESQGWPGLVFLSSYAFLTPEERGRLHMDPSRELIDQQIPAHEAAHQWWGDLVTWKTYRDQWFSEGLANYSAMMILQEKNPAAFRQVMEKYRRGLMEKNKDGSIRRDAGPVTLGSRLLSSRFPQGYEAITYGRGTWLFHMLRSMLQDAAVTSGRNNLGRSDEEEPFVRSLRKLCQRYQGKTITTEELLNVFAEDLPPSLRYEGKASLDWFMESWVNGTSLPRLELQSVKFAAKPNSVSVTGIIRQKDAGDNFVTSVPIYAELAGKATALLGRVFADGAETSFHLSAPAGTRRLLLDPNGTILTAPN